MGTVDSDAALVVESFVVNSVLLDDIIFGVTEEIVGLLVKIPLVAFSDGVSVEVVVGLTLLVDSSSARDVVLEELLLVGVDRLLSDVVVVLEELLENTVVSILAGPEVLVSTVVPVVVVGLTLLMVTVVDSVVDDSSQSRHIIVMLPETKLFWLGVDVVDRGIIVGDSFRLISDDVSVDDLVVYSGSLSRTEVVGSVAKPLVEVEEVLVDVESVTTSDNIAVSVKGFVEVEVDSLFEDPVKVLVLDSVVVGTVSEVVPVETDSVDTVVSPSGCSPLYVVVVISVVTSGVVECVSVQPVTDAPPVMLLVASVVLLYVSSRCSCLVVVSSVLAVVASGSSVVV